MKRRGILGLSESVFARTSVDSDSRGEKFKIKRNKDVPMTHPMRIRRKLAMASAFQEVIAILLGSNG